MQLKVQDAESAPKDEETEELLLFRLTPGFLPVTSPKDEVITVRLLSPAAS